MPDVRVQSTELTFTGIGTSESARQQVQYPDRNGTARALTGGVVEVVHLERTAGSSTITFTVRLYSASSAGKMRVEEAIALDASGSAAQEYTEGIRVYFNGVVYASVQASGGSGHAVKLQIQIAPSRGG